MSVSCAGHRVSWSTTGPRATSCRHSLINVPGHVAATVASGSRCPSSPGGALAVTVQRGLTRPLADHRAADSVIFPAPLTTTDLLIFDRDGPLTRRPLPPTGAGREHRLLAGPGPPTSTLANPAVPPAPQRVDPLISFSMVTHQCVRAFGQRCDHRGGAGAPAGDRIAR